VSPVRYELGFYIPEDGILLYSSSSSISRTVRRKLVPSFRYFNPVFLTVIVN
jgi:hypothetical protein